MASIDIQKYVSNQLTIEAFTILKEVAEDQAGSHGGFYAWFQNTITQAEGSGKDVRAMAAVIVMNAMAEELIDDSEIFNEDRLQERVHQGIKRMVEHE